MPKTMPSIQTRTDVIGARENKPTHVCEPRHSGKTSATARQITNRTTSAAESPHPRATTSRGLFATGVFNHTLHLLAEKWLQFPRPPPITVSSNAHRRCGDWREAATRSTSPPPRDRRAFLHPIAWVEHNTVAF